MPFIATFAMCRTCIIWYFADFLWKIDLTFVWYFAQHHPGYFTLAAKSIWLIFANIKLSSFFFIFSNMFFFSKMAVSTLVNFCSFPLIFWRSLLQNKHTLGKVPGLDEVAGDVKFDRVIQVSWSWCYRCHCCFLFVFLTGH